MDTSIQDQMPGKLKRGGLVAAALLVGVVSFAHPSLLSGLDAMQTDPGDTRFINYVLEHGYRWLTGDPLHRSFWNPPFFFPTYNAASYSETLLGSAPVYWGYRAVGIPPDTALQLWVITLVVLNFFAAYLLLARGLGLSLLAAVGGSYYFAFAGIRVVNQGHQQLLPQFFSVIVLYFIVRLFQGGPQPRLGAWFSILLAAVGVVLQLYAGFYLGWFFVFGLCVGLVVCVSLPEGREQVLRLARRSWAPLTISLLIAAGMLYWMAQPYLQGMGEIGAPAWEHVSGGVPRFISWLNPGPHSLLYGWIEGALGFTADLPIHEHRISPGLFSLCFAGLGLYLSRRVLGVKILALSAVVIFLLSLYLPGDWTAWKAVFQLVPGAPVIRVAARISLLLLIPLSIGIALLLQRLKDWRVALLLLLAVGAEQLQDIPSFSKQQTRARVARLAALVPRSCAMFYYAPSSREAGKLNDYVLHLDAMWAELATGVPTINGYSGYSPRNWGPLRDNFVGGEQDADRLRLALEGWRQGFKLEPHLVCVVGSNLQAWP